MFKEAKWFSDLKKTRKTFKNVDNAIASFKFKYDRETHITEWTLGISIAIFLSLSIVDVLNSQTTWIRVVGYVGYVITLATILISMCLHILANSRQKKAMSYLYREKDREDSGRKK